MRLQIWWALLEKKDKLLDTKVNKIDNYGESKNKQEIPGKIYKQPSIHTKNPAIGGASQGSGVATPAP